MLFSQEKVRRQEAAGGIGTEVPEAWIPAGHKVLMKFVRETVQSDEEREDKQPFLAAFSLHCIEGQADEHGQYSEYHGMLYFVLPPEQIRRRQTLS